MKTYKMDSKLKSEINDGVHPDELACMAALELLYRTIQIHTNEPEKQKEAFMGMWSTIRIILNSKNDPKDKYENLWLHFLEINRRLRSDLNTLFGTQPSPFEDPKSYLLRFIHKGIMGPNESEIHEVFVYYPEMSETDLFIEHDERLLAQLESALNEDEYVH